MTLSHEDYEKRRDEIIRQHAIYCNGGTGGMTSPELQQAIDQLFLEMVGENEDIARAGNSQQLNSIMGQSMLRKGLRTIIKGDTHEQ